MVHKNSKSWSDTENLELFTNPESLHGSTVILYFSDRWLFLTSWTETSWSTMECLIGLPLYTECLRVIGLPLHSEVIASLCWDFFSSCPFKSLIWSSNWNIKQMVKVQF